MFVVFHILGMTVLEIIIIESTLCEVFSYGYQMIIDFIIPLLIVTQLFTEKVKCQVKSQQ